MKETEDNIVLIGALGIPALGLFGVLIKGCYNRYCGSTLHQNLVSTETTPLLTPSESPEVSPRASDLLPHSINITNNVTNLNTQNNIHNNIAVVNLSQNTSPTKDQLKLVLVAMNERLNLLSKQNEDTLAQTQRLQTQTDERIEHLARWAIKADRENAAVIAEVKSFTHGCDNQEVMKALTQTIVEEGIESAEKLELPNLALELNDVLLNLNQPPEESTVITMGEVDPLDLLRGEE